MMVGLYANYGFMSYASGTYSGCPSYSSYYINHAVLLYGWNANGDWLIKNQWGTSWGMKGYMVLSSTYDCGLSYMLGYISIPIVNSNPQVVKNPECAKTYLNSCTSPKPYILSQFYNRLSFYWMLLLLIMSLTWSSIVYWLCLLTWLKRIALSDVMLCYVY